MAGKAPLLLAVVLFGVGAIGLGLTSAERARWGPFEPHQPPAPEQRVLVYDVSPPVFEPPALSELFTSITVEAEETEQQLYVAAPAETEAPLPPEPTPTPIPPLTVHGISADDAGGVAAAANTPPPPPPIRIGGISFDSEPSTETPTPEATATSTPTPAETPAPE